MVDVMAYSNQRFWGNEDTQCQAIEIAIELKLHCGVIGNSKRNI
jgi:hypothetical protein